MGGTGRQRFCVQTPVRIAEPGVEAKEAQDAKIVFRDARGCIPDKAKTARQKVRQTAQRINQLAIRRCVKRIHCEITPRRVIFDAGGKRDGRVAAKGFDIKAECCHLMRDTVRHDSDGAMHNTCRHGFQPRSFGKPHDGGRFGIGGNVHIGDGFAQQRIADAAANQERLESRIGQRGTDGLCLWPCQPVARHPHCASLSASPRRMRAVAPQM